VVYYCTTLLTSPSFGFLDQVGHFGYGYLNQGTVKICLYSGGGGGDGDGGDVSELEGGCIDLIPASIV
jgi:hypothetical protein